MKRFITAAVFAVLLTVSQFGDNGGCGLHPMKPMVPRGCDDLEAVCVCVRNQDGDLICHWEWQCIKDPW